MSKSKKLKKVETLKDPVDPVENQNQEQDPPTKPKPQQDKKVDTDIIIDEIISELPNLETNQQNIVNSQNKPISNQSSPISTTITPEQAKVFIKIPFNVMDYALNSQAFGLTNQEADLLKESFAGVLNRYLPDILGEYMQHTDLLMFGTLMISVTVPKLEKYELEQKQRKRLAAEKRDVPNAEDMIGYGSYQ